MASLELLGWGNEGLTQLMSLDLMGFEFFFPKIYELTVIGPMIAVVWLAVPSGDAKESHPCHSERDIKRYGKLAELTTWLEGPVSDSWIFR